MGVSEMPMMSGPVLLEPGTVAVACPRDPAGFGFDKAVGRSGYSSDRAASVARACLDPPNPPEPGLDALYSPLGLLFAPFGAAYGALTGGRAKLSPIQLAECESDLARTMAVMADQKQLRDQLLQIAGEITRRRLVPVDFTDRSPPDRGPVSAVLETKVEELRLERSGSKDTSFTLRIKTRVRLHRASDGKVLCDLPFEYRSESALFLDWACPKAFQGAAETGYRELAKRIAGRLLSAAPEGPMLVGAGHKNSPGRTPAGPIMLAAYKTPSQPARLVRVSFPEDDPGTLGLYSTRTPTYVSIQKPFTKDEAVSEAVSNVEWALDGLQDSRNLGLQLGACVAAIPVSLWQQTVGLVRGVTPKKFRSADAQLTAALNQAQPQFELAQQVALILTPRQSEQVFLVKNPSPAGAARSSARMPLVATPSLVSEDPATVLEIQVRSAGLTGDGGVNPSLALCVEAQATLFRVNDRAELYSCLVHYRGESRKFTQWAANDARLFRQELQRCYHDVSNTIVGELSARQLIPAGRLPQPTLAKN
jgi:hypothetical protein